MGLKRELGLFSTTLYGIGVILGAGIYALIGVGAGLAGDMLWLGFLISAVIAIFSGMSYAELSSMFPKEAAEYTYTKKAFNNEMFSFCIGWILAIGTVIAAATVALGFGGYFSHMFGVSPQISALGLIAAMSILNHIGIRESANFNNVTSITEALGLVLVVVAVFMIGGGPSHGADLMALPPSGMAGIMAAVSVIFFAYIGFENVANLAEEVKDSRNVVPKALVLSLIISTVLYMLVSIAAVSEVGWESLSQSRAPLTLVVSRPLGEFSAILSVIAMFATANTVLIFLIVASRILYGMSRGGSLPAGLSAISRRGTPYLSVFMVGFVASAFALSGEIELVAKLTDLGVFLAYLAVNLALIALAKSRMRHSFISPRVHGVPVFAYLGAIASVVMLFAFDPGLWAMEAAVITIGMVIFLLSRRKVKKDIR